MLTMQGGFDTTGSAISSALLHLDRNRDARQRLIDEPRPDGHRGRGVPPRRRPTVRAGPDREARRRGRRLPDRARATACCWCGHRATATRTVFERADEVRARPQPEPAHGVRARRPPLPRLDVGAPPDPRRADDDPAPAARLRGRPLAPRAGGDDRRHVRHVRDADHVHARPAHLRSDANRSPTPTSTSGTTSLPGMRWRFLEPDFEHPRLKGTHRLDAPRYGPHRAARRGRRRSGPTRSCTSSARCMPAPHPTQETEWLESARRRRQGYPHAIVAGCRLREPDAGDVLAANAAFAAIPWCARPVGAWAQSTPARSPARSTPPTPTVRRWS